MLQYNQLFDSRADRLEDFFTLPAQTNGGTS